MAKAAFWAKVQSLVLLTGMVLTGSVRKLGQSQSQQVLVLIAGIIHGRPLLDVAIHYCHQLFSQAIEEIG